MRIDFDALASDPAVRALREQRPPQGLRFNLTKIGHVVFNVRDLARSVEFYTQLLGLRVSDVYPPTMMPGGMVFLRFSPDHHGLALVGGATAPSTSSELHHMAFEVSSLDEVLAARSHLAGHGVTIDFEGRRRAGCQLAIEFRDPDGHRLEIYWGLDLIGSDGRARPPEQWKECFTLEEAIANPVAGQDTSLRDRK